MKNLYIIFFILFTAISSHGQIDQNLENKFRLGLSYEQANQLDKAESIYRELAEKAQWNTQYFDALNKILIRQKKYNQSATLLEEKIKQTPNDINLYGMLGSTYYMMDNLDKTYEAWERGIKTNPSSFVMYRVISSYALENRLFDKAIEILNRGKSFADDPSIFSLDLANIYAANMRFKESTEEYCSLLLKKPEMNGVVKTRIAQFINRPTAADEILGTIKNFTEENPLPVFFELLSFCYSQTDRYKEAFDSIIQYEESAKLNGSGIFTFAQEAYLNRRYDYASKAYNYLIEHFSNSPFIPTAKISYARNLEADLGNRSADGENWKPVKNPEQKNNPEYTSIINAYERVAKEYPNNSVYIEAVFSIAQIFMERLAMYNKADSLFNIVIQKSPLTNYSILSSIAKGKISILLNNLDEAEKNFRTVTDNKRSEPENIAEANYYLARIKFWQKDFSASLKIFREVTKNLSADFSNDAIEISTIINAAKRDSLNLSIFAEGDLLMFQNKFSEAAAEFKTLADNDGLFLINEFAKIKLAQILIAENKYLESAALLENLSNDSKNVLFIDKSIFLLAQIYHYGIKDSQKAVTYYKKLLEKFPNSLYFDHAREAINLLTTNNG